MFLHFSMMVLFGMLMVFEMVLVIKGWEVVIMWIWFFMDRKRFFRCL